MAYPFGARAHEPGHWVRLFLCLDGRCGTSGVLSEARMSETEPEEPETVGAKLGEKAQRAIALSLRSAANDMTQSWGEVPVHGVDEGGGRYRVVVTAKGVTNGSVPKIALELAI